MQIPMLQIPETTYCKSLDRMIQAGQFQATSLEEYDAVAPIASNDPKILRDDGDRIKDDLIEKAVKLKIGPPSVLARWPAERIAQAIADLARKE